jgi:hypothetical protein
LIEHGYSEPITGRKNMVTSQAGSAETAEFRKTSI